MDLAVYRKSDFEDNSSFDYPLSEMEKNGYTYDFVSPDLLKLESAAVSRENGSTVLAADGPSYKALVLGQRKLLTDEGGLTSCDMPLDVAQKILGYAKAVLPIVIVGGAPDSTIGFSGSAQAVQQQDAQLTAIMEEIAGLPTTRTVSEQDGVPAALAQLGVAPDARRDAPSSLLNFHRADRGADYYYLYNSDLNSPLSQMVTLKGEGVPYLLNPWNGEITPVAQYKQADGTVALEVSLEPNSSLLLAIAGDGWNGAAPADSVTETDADAVVYDADGKLAARVSRAGEYSFALGDGKTASLPLNGAQEAFKVDGWTMRLSSWSAGETVFDTVKTQMGPYELDKLVPWNEIEGLEDAAGAATYTAKFSMEEGWSEGVGAVIRFDSVSDTMKLKINGEQVTGVDQVSKQADIGKYLVKGENTIEVEVVSNLANLKSNLTQEFGIAGTVEVIPYRQTVLNLSPQEESPSSEAPSSSGEASSSQEEEHSSGSQGETPPKTGEAVPAAGFAALAALVCAGLIVSRKRK